LLPIYITRTETASFWRIFFRILFAVAAAAFLTTMVRAEKIAVLAPDKTGISVAAAERLAEALGDDLVLDPSQVDAAFRTVAVSDPFNLAAETAKQIGEVIGCDHFIFVKGDVLRRASLERPTYFEAYAAIFVVSTRTGQLVVWKLESAEAADASTARISLFKELGPAARELISRVNSSANAEIAEKDYRGFPEVPDADSPAGRNFRAPVPFNRIKPEYTRLAYLYDVTATVEALVDLDQDGAVIQVQIVRWAGFGLDEAVVDVVRKMNWRPAERGGRALPSRFLLRYNFKKIEKQ
jgi:hypothetical protein